MNPSVSLETARIPELPSTGFYIPNFISEDEEAYILSEIQRLPSSRWTVLSHRRLLSLPSQLTGSQKNTVISALLPKFLDTPILPRFASLQIFADSPHSVPNHCLVNEYQPGEGIMPHTDGPAYYPITATISLGSHTILNIYEKNEQGERQTEPTWKILQEPRSLLVTASNMYGDTLHGIAEIQVDEQLNADNIVNWELLGDRELYKDGHKARGVRISLTYRDVLKVAKLGGAMNFMNKR